jgi:hypothetical protein
MGHKRPSLRLTTWACVLMVAGCGGSLTPTSARSPKRAGAVSPFAIAPRLERDGNPIPGVGAYPDGAASAVQHAMCRPPSGACAAVPVVNGVPLPGSQPAGTLFRVRARYHGHVYSSAARWHGALRAISRPALSGALRVGATVVARPARWTGGWSTDLNQLAIEACRTRSATHCVMLSGVWLQCARLGCGIGGGVIGDHSSDGETRVGYALSGWFLFSLDARMSPGPGGLVGFSSPAALPVWPTSPIVVRSAPYGPVAGPPGPVVQILRRPEVRGRHVVVASVGCEVRCHAWVTVSLAGRHLPSSRHVAWSANRVLQGSGELGVWGAIPHRRVAVVINVGDGPYVRGHTEIR